MRTQNKQKKMEQLLDNAHGISSDKNKTSKQKQTKNPNQQQPIKKPTHKKETWTRVYLVSFFFGSGTTEGTVEKCNGITNSKI